jgi:hypothetical protein
VAPEVYFRPVPRAAGGLQTTDLTAHLGTLAAALGLGGGALPGPGGWALKVHFGGPNRPAAVDPAWARTVANLLAGPGAARPPRGTFAFDTLSITTEGLHDVPSHYALAAIKGFGGPTADLPFVVADDPQRGPALAATVPVGSALAAHTVAAGLAGIAGLCVLTPVRPHPHAGLRGALTTLGLGLADRAGKLNLHRDIRPQVDTPLCAGCGVCLTVCLFEAIKLAGGRAYIDHTLCTGCGECMNVCFMAGIEADQAVGIPAFQAKVADAALAARDRLVGPLPDRQAYFSFLMHLDRHGAGTRSRNRRQLGDLGILASHDPVALDQATWDLIEQGIGGPLATWSGFQQVPDSLLNHAEAIGLGRRAHQLVTV